MVLLGDKNWYFPSWLEWLPRIEGEGGQTVESETPTSDRGANSPVLAQLEVQEGVGD